MIINKLKNPIHLTLFVILIIIIFIYSGKSANASISTINLISAVAGVQTQTFNVPAGYSTVKISGGAIDDRGPVSINGTQALFQCSNWKACPDAGSFIVLGTSPCILANSTTFPIDITSLVFSGSNNFTVNVDDCGGNITGFNYNIEITIFNPSCTLAIDRTGVFFGETATLSWTVTNAITANITGIGALTPAEITAGSGSKTTPPITGNVTYNMSVTGPGGTGTCDPVNVGILTPPTGGLIPCGRMVNNPDTGDIDESQPCSLCALFYMLKNIINFVMTLSVGVAVFILIMSGLFYALSAGNSRTVELAKSAATSAIIGIAIIIVAWLVIAVILQGLGYASFTTWNQVSCVLPT